MADLKFSGFGAVADPAGGEVVGLKGGSNARFPAEAFATAAQGVLASNAIPKALVTAKGQLIGASANGVPVVVPAPAAEGMLLFADAAEASGMGWKSGGLKTIMAAQSVVAQSPVSIGVPIQVSFGPQIITPEVTMAADGTATFTIGGSYFILTNVYFVRSASTQETTMMLRALVNDVQAGNPVAIALTDAANSQFQQLVFVGTVVAGTTLKVQVVRDSGDNDGRLQAFTAATPGWGTAPSAIMRIFKF